MPAWMVVVVGARTAGIRSAALSTSSCTAVFVLSWTTGTCRTMEQPTLVGRIWCRSGRREGRGAGELSNAPCWTRLLGSAGGICR